jgi:type VI secretion system Hcp family effector
MKSLPALMGGALALLAPAARADIKGWLDFGSDVPGESTDVGHEGWANVEAFSSKLHPPGGPKLICHRKADKASPRLFEACANGKVFKEVKLDVAKTGDNKPVNFWEMTLKDVLITSYAGVPDPGGAAEVISLEWKSLIFTYRVFPPGGSSYATTTLISPDTDGDGLPDAYEQTIGLDSTVSNLGLDSDHDGLPDTAEYRLGTHPNDPTSFFSAVASIAMPDNGGLNLKWPSVSGEEYQIEYSPDLATPFATVATVTATSGETTFTVARTLQAGFFRVTKTLP